jgi:hypothetical protein
MSPDHGKQERRGVHPDYFQAGSCEIWNGRNRRRYRSPVDEASLRYGWYRTRCQGVFERRETQSQGFQAGTYRHLGPESLSDPRLLSISTCICKLRCKKRLPKQPEVVSPSQQWFTKPAKTADGKLGLRYPTANPNRSLSQTRFLRSRVEPTSML